MTKEIEDWLSSFNCQKYSRIFELAGVVTLQSLRCLQRHKLDSLLKCVDIGDEGLISSKIHEVMQTNDQRIQSHQGDTVVVNSEEILQLSRMVPHNPEQVIHEHEQQLTTAIKRKRGRPPGSKNRSKEQLGSASGKKVFGVVDPVTGQFIKRGRGRPRKDVVPILMEENKIAEIRGHRGIGRGHGSTGIAAKDINHASIFAKSTTSAAYNTCPSQQDQFHGVPEVSDAKSSMMMPRHIQYFSGSTNASSQLPCIRPKQCICSLCGFPTNYSVLGVLYGPFHYLDGHFVKSGHQQLSMNRQQDSGNNAGAQIAANMHSTSTSSKEREEIWVHEDCVVWSPGVYLLGDTVVGLAEAVKIGRKNKCSVCGTFGGTIGCLYKGCDRKYHYLCSRQSGCLLDEDNFTVVCQKHKDCKQNIVSLSPEAIAWKKTFLKSKRSKKTGGQ